MALCCPTIMKGRSLAAPTSLEPGLCPQLPCGKGQSKASPPGSPGTVFSAGSFVGVGGESCVPGAAWLSPAWGPANEARGWLPALVGSALQSLLHFLGVIGPAALTSCFGRSWLLPFLPPTCPHMATGDAGLLVLWLCWCLAAGPGASCSLPLLPLSLPDQGDSNAHRALCE